MKSKSTPNRFRLSPRGVMIAVVSAAFSNPAFANTGKVDFAFGNISVTGPDGRGRPLTKGAEVKSGDKIVSSTDGRAQIRFSDGAYVSLQPNSEFDIKEYRFDGKADGTESALFGLFRGAMRTVTGLVGGVNRNRYQISTPTATIGIRGTGGLIAIGGDGSTLVTGTSGIWSLTNQGGTLDIPAGTAGFAGADVNVPPQPRAEGPVVPPPQSAPQLQTIVRGDVVDSNGSPVSLGVRLVPRLISGPGYAVAHFGAGGPNNSQFAGLAVKDPSNATFDGSGQLTQFDGFTGLPSASIAATFTLAGTQLEAGTNGILAWGRWQGDVQVSTASGTSVVNLTANQGLHYVAGLPTPSMPTGDVNFTYSLISATSATSPTLANGSIAPGVLTSASLSGNFSTPVLAVSLSGSMPEGSTFAATNVGGLISGSTFSVVGAPGSATITGGTISCSASCGINVNGFFSGTNATHAGFMYQISNVFSGGLTSLSGAAALQR